MRFSKAPNSLERFFSNIQLDLRLFLFVLALLTIYRLYFLWYISPALASDITLSDLWLTNITGLRLSLKSAGAITLLSFALVSLPSLVIKSRLIAKIRYSLGLLASLVLALLFEARFPYFKEYNATFGQAILNGLYDDKSAIFSTIINEPFFWGRLLMAIFLAIFSYLIYRKFLSAPTISPPRLFTPLAKGLFSLLLAAIIVLFSLFVRFGGGVSYATGINWENAGLTRSHILNELILDDMQALYRAYKSHQRIKGGFIYGVDKEHLPELLSYISGKEYKGDAIADYLNRSAKGAVISKPEHIFIILGETYMQWPLLAKYNDLHIADGLKSLISSQKAYYTPNFLPNGNFTAIAITGVVAGLPDVNIPVQYQPKSNTQVYPTAIAPIFHRLGYRSEFWYGGMSSWYDMGRFTIAQGFDSFFGYPDYHAPKTNTWGTNDGYLLEAVEKSLPGKSPTLHVIMTTSNHPPYNIDLASIGYDAQAMTAKIKRLIPTETSPEELSIELGHYFYMDKLVTEFVKHTSELYPDSLFIITGDHAVRSNPGQDPTLFEEYSVPLVIYGAGSDILPPNAIGSHTGITPTLIELIAPKGFIYHSLAPAIGEREATFNTNVFLTAKAIGEIEGSRVESLPHTNGSPAIEGERQKLFPLLTALRTIARSLLE